MTGRRFIPVLAAVWALGPASTPMSRASTDQADTPVFILVHGAPGEDAYADDFSGQVAAWQKAAFTVGARCLVIGQGAQDSTPDRGVLESSLAAQSKSGSTPLWLVLIGHGTFDKKQARFNLRGDDVTATELAAWLQPFQRPVAVINTASASAPFIAALSAPGRVVVTATRSGQEKNVTRFGASLASLLGDPAADLDQDRQVSLLEVFLAAAAKVGEFYKTEGRLATEHALIDDTGDGLGTPASWFRGLRAVKKPRDAAALDGARAHQWLITPDRAAATQSPEWRTRRDSLEAAIATLRDEKPTLESELYFQRLDALLLELAHHYESVPPAPPLAAPAPTQETR